ncbi:hypothetical protein EYF80_022523 [Liparis tanakae]|uniref:Uncharacterized protein n=1 Tax=Liparis tanakae TaxID=230148 RepID=A0A4Z2HQL8_9TELE|nr:hypothetical protein EYF80_022523 [Liparis tanakae]
MCISVASLRGQLSGSSFWAPSPPREASSSWIFLPEMQPSQRPLRSPSLTLLTVPRAQVGEPSPQQQQQQFCSRAPGVVRVAHPSSAMPSRNSFLLNSHCVAALNFHATTRMLMLAGSSTRSSQNCWIPSIPILFSSWGSAKTTEKSEQNGSFCVRQYTAVLSPACVKDMNCRTLSFCEDFNLCCKTRRNTRLSADPGKPHRLVTKKGKVRAASARSENTNN